MTLPNNQPPSPAIPFGVTGSGSATDGTGTTTADLSTRTQGAIQTVIGNQVAGSPNWTASSLGVFGGILGGLPGLFISFFTKMLGLGGVFNDLPSLLNSIEQVPLLSQLISLIEGIAGGLGQVIESPVTILDDIVGGVKKILSFIPGFNIVGQVRPGTAPVAAGSSVANINPELVWETGFDSAATVQALLPWISWDGTTGRTKVGSLLIQPDGAAAYSSVANPVPVTGDHELAVSIYAKWQGIVYTGDTPIQLHVLEYTAGVRGQSFEVAAFTSPPATESSWQQLSLSGYVPSSTSVDTIYLRPLVDVSCTAGKIWFDDASVTKINALPSSVLANIPVDAVNGIQGQASIGDSMQATWDNASTSLANALGLSGVDSSGNSLSTLAGTLHSAGSTASTAASQAADATNTLAIQNNRSTAAGLEATVESNMTIQDLGNGSAPTFISVTQAVSGGAVLRIAQTKIIGFLQYWVYLSGTVTAFYLNFYRMNATGGFDFLFRSADQHASLPTASPGSWQIYFFSGANDISVVPGDVICVEYQVVGSGTAFVAGLGQTWQTDHPTADTKRSGFTNNWGTGSAASITTPTYTGIHPYVGLGVSNLPLNYQPPDDMVYNTAGVYTYALPPWLAAGDKIERIALGGGAGGLGGSVTKNGLGGGAGVWNADTLVYGVDIPLTTTTLTVTVGAGGGNSANGGASSVAGTGVTTLTAAGGVVAASANISGVPAGNETWPASGGTLYVGGTGSGAAPGSGGQGGAYARQASGFPGAPGSVWLKAHQ